MGQLEDMHMFVRVVDAGGISRAADQLGLAKSAVSRRLAELETRLGVRLVNRTTRRSSLTDSGRTYYERAIKVLDDVTELTSQISDASSTLSGSIKLAAPLSFGLEHLSSALDCFARLHPQVNINVDFSDRKVDLVGEGMDLAFRIAELKDSSLIARRISPIRLLLCASPGYLQTHGTPKTPAELEDHKLLHYSISGTASWKLTDGRGRQHLVDITPVMTANNGEFLKDMAIAGHGIVASPTFISWRAIASGELVPILGGFTLPTLNAYAVYPQTRYLSQRVRVLIDFLIERFGDNPFWDRDIDAQLRASQALQSRP